MQGDDITVLWRPVGPEELDLLEASGWRRFPPRLPGQPIFYPVLHRAYAIQIARDWNVASQGSGFVVRFRVRSSFLEAYEPKVVGAREHAEYWIPAEDLDRLNDNIVGRIEVTDRFDGSSS